MTGSSRHTLHWGNDGRRLRVGISIAAAAVALTGCTSSDRIVVPAPAAAPPVSAPPVSGPVQVTSAPPCTGADGEAVVKKLFSDLSLGKKIDLGTYFVAPADFVRWVDPGAYVTFLPADDGSLTLAALQSRLDALERQHVTIAMTDFTDHGYGGDPINNDLGSWFSFTVHGRPDATAPESGGAGKAAIDCVAKKIKVLVLDTL
jgi:hypothetical protein